MVLEQFIRQFKLYEKYEKMMMSDGNVYIAKKDIWSFFEQKCSGKKYWFTTWKDSNLKNDFSYVRREFFDSCGSEMVEKAENSNLNLQEKKELTAEEKDKKISSFLNNTLFFGVICHII